MPAQPVISVLRQRPDEEDRHTTGELHTPSHQTPRYLKTLCDEPANTERTQIVRSKPDHHSHLSLTIPCNQVSNLLCNRSRPTQSSKLANPAGNYTVCVERIIKKGEKRERGEGGGEERKERKRGKKKGRKKGEEREKDYSAAKRTSGRRENDLGSSIYR